MNLQEFNQKMKEFAELCEAIEQGRRNIEILFDFVSSDTIDDAARLSMANRLYAQMPVLAASYQRTQTLIAYVHNHGTLPPPPEPPVEETPPQDPPADPPVEP